MKMIWRHWGLRIAFLAALGLLFVFGCEEWIAMAGKARCHDDVKATPEAPVAVVLGTSARLADGRANLFFLPRMEAAAALFKAGKVRALIVSGDNGSQGYDEPTEMKRVLTDIQTGKFTSEWMQEYRAGMSRFKGIRRNNDSHQIEEVGAKLRAMMPWIAKNQLVDKTKN